MNIGKLALCAAALGITVTACSSDPAPVQAQPGMLAAGTAQITVNDKDLGQFQNVQCTQAGALTTVVTGDDKSGSTVVISNADGLKTQSVSIRDLGGFTGSFNQGLGGQSEVNIDGKTYTVTGTADGFATDNASFRTSGTFTIKVAC